MTVSGCFGSVAVGFVLDRFLGRLKTATAILMLLSTAAFAIFAAAVAGWLPLSHAATVKVAYASGILGGFFFNCTTPLYFEIMMETVFGWASENSSGAVLILVKNHILALLSNYIVAPSRKRLFIVNLHSDYIVTCLCGVCLGQHSGADSLPCGPYRDGGVGSVDELAHTRPPYLYAESSPPPHPKVEGNAI